MITIKPAVNAEKIKNYLSLENDYLIYMEAKDGDVLIGGGAANTDGEIITIKSDFPMLNDGIIKSFINFFDRHDTKNIYSLNKDIFEDLIKARFKEEGKKCTLNTDEYFGKPCKDEQK